MSHYRKVSQRTQGVRHGPITRLVSPDGLGEELKPFVFLDYLDTPLEPGFGFGFHPHSGIATLTYQLESDVDYEDTSGQRGIVRARGLEWMQAGGGVWHRGSPVGSTRARGFQLWLALPPEAEDGPSKGIYVPPEAVPTVGPVHVLLGAWGGAASPIPLPSALHYFHVELAAGATWVYRPMEGYDVAWALDPLVIHTPAGAQFLFGAAPYHDHALVLGPSSVHTNLNSLRQGAQRIREIGEMLSVRRL
jgi:redox-sensitive bicupin YhaK (pirin superfamily)